MLQLLNPKKFLKNHAQKYEFQIANSLGLEQNNTLYQ